ncbi:hypothetical protein [Ensifer adhaerens]|nr:hypothetical protein [Ensifer adhaerens]
MTDQLVAKRRADVPCVGRELDLGKAQAALRIPARTELVQPSAQ